MDPSSNASTDKDQCHMKGSLKKSETQEVPRPKIIQASPTTGQEEEEIGTVYLIFFFRKGKGTERERNFMTICKQSRQKFGLNLTFRSHGLPPTNKYCSDA